MIDQILLEIIKVSIDQILKLTLEEKINLPVKKFLLCPCYVHVIKKKVKNWNLHEISVKSIYLRK